MLELQERRVFELKFLIGFARWNSTRSVSCHQCPVFIKTIGSEEGFLTLSDTRTGLGDLDELILVLGGSRISTSSRNTGKGSGLKAGASPG